MDIEWLKEACQRTRKDDAVGMDGMTAVEYEQELEGIPAPMATCHPRPRNDPARGFWRYGRGGV